MSHAQMNRRPPSYRATDNTFPLEQDARSPWISLIGISLVVAYVLHRIVVALDKPILSPLELAWNCIVFLMPARLISCLASRWGVENGNLSDASGSSTQHAAKSDVLRRVFGLGEKNITSSKNSGIPAGLGNWDNSCYQNSVLQALASIESLGTFWEEVDDIAGENLQDTSLTALRHLIEDLNNNKNHGRRLWTPSKLKSMSSWQQQDAQEYFSKMIEQLDKDITLLLRKTDSSLKDVIVEDNETTYKSLSTKARKVIENPLEGLLAQRVGCIECGFTEGLMSIPFNCLTVSLGKDWECDIRDSLDNFTSLESIEGVECAKCTLLHTKRQLRKLSETLKAADHDADEGNMMGNEHFLASVQHRLEAVSEALREENFEEKTLKEKCQIPSRLRTTSTKTRQAVVMRPPKCLVVHVNRSVFDEYTGAQLKNYANVSFPMMLDLKRWCAGSKLEASVTESDLDTEKWEVDPRISLLSNSYSGYQSTDPVYQLRAVITHYGRHENGHYICYRKIRSPLPVKSENEEGKDEDDPLQDSTGEDKWWRFSDDDVTEATENEVSSQGGAFMLFYERLENPPTAFEDEYYGGPAIELANMPPILESSDNLLHVAGSESPPATPSSLPSLANSSSSDDELEGSSSRTSREMQQHPNREAGGYPRPTDPMKQEDSSSVAQSVRDDKMESVPKNSDDHEYRTAISQVTAT